MRALVTGGAGFAGSHLATHLLDRGHEVVLLDRPQTSSRPPQAIQQHVRSLSADLRDFAVLRAALDEVRPERIYHLAAFSSLIESIRDPRYCYDVNFNGTLNLLEACRQIGFDTRVLLVSSSNVYGVAAGAELPLRETSPLRAENPYGGSKVASEFMAVQFGLNYGLHIVRARPFQHTGPGQSPAYVCSGLARQVAEIDVGARQPVIEVGNPGVSRDFSDVRDVVRGYALLLERGRPGDVYQLCSGRATPVAAIIESLIARVQASIEVRIDPSKARAGESQSLWGDPAKARSETGWEPEYNLEQTLTNLLCYWKECVSS